jgi:hypothetical protein
VRFVRSALVTFAAETSAHAAGRCTAPGAAPFLLVPADRAAAGGRR